MAAALRAVHFGASHAIRAVHGRPERTRERRIETRPPGARLELRVVGEQLLAAAGARERAGALLGQERAAPRPLGRVVPQDLVLLRRQDSLPLVVGFLNRKLFGHHFSTLPQSKPNFGFSRGPLIVIGRMAPLPFSRKMGSNGLRKKPLMPPAASETVAFMANVPAKSSCWLRSP